MDFNNFKNVLKTNIPTKISAFLNSGKKKTLAKIVFQEWKVPSSSWFHMTAPNFLFLSCNNPSGKTVGGYTSQAWKKKNEENVRTVPLC